MNLQSDSSKKIEQFDLQAATASLREDGIICVQIKDDMHIEIKQSMEMFEVVKKFAGGKKRPVLVLTGSGGTISNEVREFSSSQEANEPTLAEAIVAKGLAHKLIVNFLLKFHKSGRPMKMFTNEPDAVKWLMKMESEYCKSILQTG